MSDPIAMTFKADDILDDAPPGFDATMSFAWLVKVPMRDHTPALYQRYEGAFRSVMVRVPTIEAYPASEEEEERHRAEMQGADPRQPKDESPTNPTA